MPVLVEGHLDDRVMRSACGAGSLTVLVACRPAYGVVPWAPLSSADNAINVSGIDSTRACAKVTAPAPWCGEIRRASAT